MLSPRTKDMSAYHAGYKVLERREDEHGDINIQVQETALERNRLPESYQKKRRRMTLLSPDGDLGI